MAQRVSSSNQDTRFNLNQVNVRRVQKLNSVKVIKMTLIFDLKSGKSL